MNKITEPAMMAAVLAYCRANRIECWALHTPPGSTIGGLSCRLLSIDGDAAETMIANGERRTVLLSELHLRAGDPWA